MTSVVDGGSGHSGKRAAEIHLGVGQTLQNELLDVKVTWRDETGVRSEIIRAAPGRYEVVLGENGCRKTFPADADLREESCRVLGPGQ